MSSTELKSRYNSLRQAKSSNTDPRHRAVISRQNVPIVDDDFYILTEIDDAIYSRVACAVSRPDIRQPGEVAYIGGITGGDAKIYSMELIKGKPGLSSVLYQTISTVKDIAMCFIGSYTEVKKTNRVELQTSDLYTFYIDSNDDLFSRKNDDVSSDTLIATSVVAVGAVMGIEGEKGINSQGLVVAYCTTTGLVFTRQFYDGVWETGNQVGEAPANIADITIDRTWDYKLALSMKDFSGAIYLILSKAVVSGLASIEKTTISNVEANIEAGHIDRINGYDTEKVDISNVEAGSTVGYTDAPIALSAENIDDSGNFGVKVRIVFDTDLSGIGDGSAWTIEDNNMRIFSTASVAFDGADQKTLIITLADFNNAVNPITIKYDSSAGNLKDIGGYVNLADVSVQFTAAGLVPFVGPTPTAYEIIDEKTLIVTFDENIIASNWANVPAALKIEGEEPEYSPEGNINTEEYVIDSVEQGATLDKIKINLTDTGRMKHPQGNVSINYNGTGGLTNAAGTTPVESYNGNADPDVAGFNIFVNPNDPEKVDIVDVAGDILIGQIEKEYGYNEGMVQINDVTAEILVGFTEDIPT